MTEDSGRRRTWAVIETDLTRATAQQVCTAFLDVTADLAPWAYVDAWSDYRDELPFDVEHAQTALRQLHLRRDGRDTGMGVAIDRTDPAQESLLRTYAAWSIHVELLSAGQETVVTFHDGASSITAELLDGEVESVRERLSGVAAVELLDPLTARTSRSAGRGAAGRASSPPRPDDDGRTLLRPVPSSLRAGTVFVVMGAVVVVAVGLVIAVGGLWQFSPMLLLGVGYVARGLLLRRARVVLVEGGLIVNTGGVRDRHLAWADVAQVVVDPPGGPRLLRVRLHVGGEVQLPELSEHDRARVLAAGPR